MCDGEFLVALDFSENYSFCVHYAIQAYHWSNAQATLHPYVIYNRKNNKLRNDNFVIISEGDKHNTTSVHLFNKKLISYLKAKHGEEKIKKIVYFSDGAASQYKNKSNFINLVHHKKDFNIDAEWHFFDTSHGKGACDGIEGTVTRKAYKCICRDHMRIKLRHPKIYMIGQKIFFQKLNLISVRKKNIKEWNFH